MVELLNVGGFNYKAWRTRTKTTAPVQHLDGSRSVPVVIPPTATPSSAQCDHRPARARAKRNGIDTHAYRLR